MTPSSLSYPAGSGGGNYQQSQQSHSWTDGNTQGQHQQLQQSWSWQGQQQITNPIALQPPQPLFSPLLQDNNSHHLLHQQMHQNATSHFQQVQSHHHQQLADIHRNMSNFAMGSVAPMMLQNQPQPQPQIAYQQIEKNTTGFAFCDNCRGTWIESIVGHEPRPSDPTEAYGLCTCSSTNRSSVCSFKSSPSSRRCRQYSCSIEEAKLCC